MESKLCNKCGEIKPISDFGKNKSKKDGLQAYCKECTKIYRHNHYIKNREVYIEQAKRRKEQGRMDLNNYKSKLVCSKCGEDRWWVLDFHHTNPDEKEGSISNLIDSPNKLEKELEKCIVLCSNCHRDLHFQLDQNKERHNVV